MIGLRTLSKLIYTQTVTPTNTPTKVEISHKTVIFTLGFLAFVWFLFQIRDIIFMVFLSVILVAAFLKPVEWLNTRRVPRVFSVLLVYFLMISLVSVAIGIIIPPLVEQTSALVTRLPQIISTINDFFTFANIPVEDVSSVISRQIQGFIGNIVSISTAILSSIFLVLTVLVISFYLLLDWQKFITLASSPFSGRQEKKVANVIAKLEAGLGKWVRGQISLSFIVGVLTYIGLELLGVPYALPLALVAAILEIIPIIGPIIAAIPAILVGFTISPFMGTAAAALFLVVQQLENHVIVPMIMSKVIGLQPPVIIVSLLIGAKIAGIGGAFLAPPVLIIAKIIISEFLKEDEKFDESLNEQ